VYRNSYASAGREPDWILRRYTWIGRSRDEILEHVLPDYVNRLFHDWRGSVKHDGERALFQRLDQREAISAETTAADRLGEHPAVPQRRPRFGAPASVAVTYTLHSEQGFRGRLTTASLGDLESVSNMIRFIGNYVIAEYQAHIDSRDH
jgi:hypothetical protein